MRRSLIRLVSILMVLCMFSMVIPCGSAREIARKFPIRQPPVEVENDPNDPEAAQNISGIQLITNYVGFYSPDKIFDRQKSYGQTSFGNASLTLEYEEGIGYLYFIFGKEYGEYTLTNHDTGESVICGSNRFLHELIDLEELFGEAVHSLTLDFSNGPVSIYELSVYTPGYLPEHVQDWSVPKEGSIDLILFPTHGDDDQLFFAGLLPYYCALDYEVLVVYMTNHSNAPYRVHEMLNGLWGVGVTTYPVFGGFSDFFAESITTAYNIFRQGGVEREDLVSFITEQLRRYQPKVVVGHDFAGEYGHGQHRAYADCLAAALEASPDQTQFPDSAQSYGVWDVPKAYFHLYEENPIVMDWDTPMEELDGMTPFEVTQIKGYPHHVSQRESWISVWLNGYGFSVKKASDITLYSPCLYGLYRTTVGLDSGINDMFENVLSHREQARQEEEARLKAEEEARLQAEEEARLKAEEEAKRQEQARQEAQEAENRKKAEEALSKAEKTRTTALIIISILAVGYVVLGYLTREKKHR